jgi:hypothetical protein
MKETKRREFFKTVGVAAFGGYLIEGMGRLHAEEELDMGDKSKEFAAGEKVPVSGIYDVTHDKLDGDDHTQPHQVTLIAGTFFPRCKVCGEWVRFRLYQAAEHVEASRHFAQ